MELVVLAGFFLSVGPLAVLFGADTRAFDNGSLLRGKK